jgi:hypothetical protein
MRFPSKPLLAALLLTMFSAAHAQSSATGAQNQAPSVEEAKRDLQSLGATEKQRVDLEKKPSSAQPAGAPFYLGESPLPSVEQSNQTKTWLVDAAQPTSRETRELKGKGGSEKTVQTDGPNQGPEGAAAPANPLFQFLPQWLSTRDLQVMRGAGDTPARGTVQDGQTFERNRTAELKELGPEPLMPQLNSARSPLQDRKNPYLDLPGSSVLSSPLPEQQRPALAAMPVFGEIPSVPSGQGSPQPADKLTKPNTPQSAESAIRRTEAPPPTAPIVDDRKYFPQLRRF